jgi:hypothetical protein
MGHCITFNQKKRVKNVPYIVKKSFLLFQLIFISIPTQVMHGVWKVDG